MATTYRLENGVQLGLKPYFDAINPAAWNGTNWKSNNRRPSHPNEVLTFARRITWAVGGKSRPGIRRDWRLIFQIIINGDPLKLFTAGFQDLENLGRNMAL